MYELISAIFENDLDKVATLIRTRPELINPRDGELPLVKAIKEESVEMVQMLLDAGADPNIENMDGLSAVRFAVLIRNIELVRLLIAAGGDFDILINNKPTLVYAAACWFRSAIGPIARSGVDLNAQDNGGNTAAHYLAYFGLVDEIKILIDAGADFKIFNLDGYTPLMNAILKNRLECVKLLISVSNINDTTLHVAASQSLQCVELLLDNGADVNLRDSDGETPLHCAAKYSKYECIMKLIEAGANVDSINDDGKTTLSLIEYYCDNALHKSLFALIRAGADVSVSDHPVVKNYILEQENQRLRDEILELKLRPGGGPLYLESKNSFYRTAGGGD